jgi:hypothetical protein
MKVKFDAKIKTKYYFAHFRPNDFPENPKKHKSCPLKQKRCPTREKLPQIKKDAPNPKSCQKVAEHNRDSPIGWAVQDTHGSLF